MEPVTQPTKVRVFCFDDSTMLTRLMLEDLGLEAEFLHSEESDTDFVSYARLDAPNIGEHVMAFRALRAADRATELQPDLVIVGNNLGAGVDKARIMHLRGLSDRVIVLWNGYRPGEEQPYLEFGCKYFGSRMDSKGVQQMILTILGERAAAPASVD